jgi:hypothetical protein
MLSPRLSSNLLLRLCPQGTRGLLPLGLLGGLLCASPAAQAADDDDFEFEEEEEEEKPKKNEKDDGELDETDPDEALKSGGGSGEGLDLDDDEDMGTVKPRGPGEDTAVEYRKALEEFSQLSGDEEALAWERYLRKYPQSLFRSRIEARLEEINQEMYNDEITGPGRAGDAGKQEIFFAQPMLLESIDPRTKLRGGFEWGFPNWINLMVDYEHQITRESSAHVGIRNRFSGWSFEGGGKYALVKSARSKLLVTGIADMRLNLGPAFFAFRPQLGVGKRFQFNKDLYLDAQIQGGSDLAFVKYDLGTGVETKLDPRTVGGINLSLAPTQNLRIYFETSTYMKDLGGEVAGNLETGSFRFNQLTFGMKYIQWKSKKSQKVEAGFGASAPYTSNYWAYHFGSITGDANYYFPQ